MENEFLNARPAMKIEPIGLDVPCNIECLRKSRYAWVLDKRNVVEQIEIMDSILVVIKEKVDSLLSILEESKPEPRVNVGNTAFALYQMIINGREPTLGDALALDDRVILSGNYQEVYSALSWMERLARDENVREICKEIKYLVESLWTHFDQNVRRSLGS